MSRVALLTCKSVEKDPTVAESLQVDCARCDPDNPTPVPREKCPACRGTGRVPTALPAIVSELRTSRLELLKGGKYESDSHEL